MTNLTSSTLTIKIAADTSGFDDAIGNSKRKVVQLQDASGQAGAQSDVRKSDGSSGDDEVQRLIKRADAQAALAKAYETGNIALVRQAEIQARIDVKSVGKDGKEDVIATALKKQALADLSLAVAKYTMETDNAIAAENAMATAWTKGADAARQQALANQAIGQIRQFKAEGDPVAQAKIVADVVAKDLATRQAAMAELGTKQREANDLAQAEYQTLTLTDAERAKTLAVFQATNDLKAKGVDLSAADTQEYLRQVGAMAEYKVRLADNMHLADGFASSIGGALETSLLDPAAKFSDVWGKALKDIQKQVLDMAVIKPFENWMSGSITQMMTGAPPSGGGTPVASPSDIGAAVAVGLSQVTLKVTVVDAGGNPVATPGGVSPFASNAAPSGASQAGAINQDVIAQVNASALKNSIDPSTLYAAWSAGFAGSNQPTSNTIAATAAAVSNSPDISATSANFVANMTGASYSVEQLKAGQDRWLQSMMAGVGANYQVANSNIATAGALVNTISSILGGRGGSSTPGVGGLMGLLGGASGLNGGGGQGGGLLDPLGGGNGLSGLLSSPGDLYNGSWAQSIFGGTLPEYSSPIGPTLSGATLDTGAAAGGLSGLGGGLMGAMGVGQGVMGLMNAQGPGSAISSAGSLVGGGLGIASMMLPGMALGPIGMGVGLAASLIGSLIGDGPKAVPLGGASMMGVDSNFTSGGLLNTAGIHGLADNGGSSAAGVTALTSAITTVNGLISSYKLAPTADAQSVVYKNSSMQGISTTGAGGGASANDADFTMHWLNSHALQSSSALVNKVVNQNDFNANPWTAATAQDRLKQENADIGFALALQKSIDAIHDYVSASAEQQAATKASTEAVVTQYQADQATADRLGMRAEQDQKITGALTFQLQQMASTTAPMTAAEKSVADLIGTLTGLKSVADQTGIALDPTLYINVISANLAKLGESTAPVSAATKAVADLITQLRGIQTASDLFGAKQDPAAYTKAINAQLLQPLIDSATPISAVTTAVEAFKTTMLGAKQAADSVGGSLDMGKVNEALNSQLQVMVSAATPISAATQAVADFTTRVIGLKVAADSVGGSLNPALLKQSFTDIATSIAAPFLSPASGAATALKELATQIDSLRKAAAGSGADVTGLINTLNSIVTNGLVKNFNASQTAALNSANGNDFLNQLTTAEKARDASQRDAASLGMGGANVEAVYSATIGSILKGLNADQIVTALNTYGKGLISSVQAEEARRIAVDANTKKLNDANTSVSFFTSAITSFQGQISALNTGALSPLSPLDQYNAAKSTYQTDKTAAAGGDQTAMGKLIADENAFLTASKAYNATNAQYVADFGEVQATNTQMVSVAQQQLDVSKQIVAALQGTIIANLQTIDAAIVALGGAINHTATTPAAVAPSVPAGGGGGGGGGAVAPSGGGGGGSGPGIGDFGGPSLTTIQGVVNTMYAGQPAAAAQVNQDWSGIAAVGAAAFNSSPAAAQAAAYLSNNQDVLNAYLANNNGVDAVTFAQAHYAQFGQAEGRAYRNGGIIGAYASGGIIGNGIWDQDSVRARYAGGGDIMLAGGEAITRAPSVNDNTRPVLDFINRTGQAPSAEPWAPPVFGASRASAQPSEDMRAVVEELRALKAELATLKAVSAAGSRAVVDAVGEGNDLARSAPAKSARGAAR